MMNSILEAVGNVPLIRLRKLSSGNVFAKAEFLNPGGSIKDRSVFTVSDDEAIDTTRRLAQEEGAAGRNLFGRERFCRSPDGQWAKSSRDGIAGSGRKVL